MKALPSPGYVRRHSKTSIERYHGPWTLEEQCRLLSEDLLSTFNQDEEDGSGDHADHHIAILSKQLLEGNVEATTSSVDSEDLLWTRSPEFVSLPPRQFLEVTLETYFKQVDFATDIFARETVNKAIHQVYNEHNSEWYQAWTVCLNLIVLHALGTNGPIKLDDPFMSPLFQATRFVTRSPEFFLTPRLVVLQALALRVSHLGFLLATIRSSLVSGTDILGTESLCT